jgi:hypothetical protein
MKDEVRLEDLREGAAPEVTASVLGQLPPPGQQAYRDRWQPGYAKLTLWASPSLVILSGHADRSHHEGYVDPRPTRTPNEVGSHLRP